VAQEQTDYHHLFGLLLQDFFTGTPCHVELERDLSVKSQFLDVLVIHKTGGPLDRVLPDGLEGHLAEYNLVTFKSHREALTGWSVLELIGHFVNLRKQTSPNFDDLLPESHFRLFAICARFPEGLAAQIPLTEVQRGVYESLWGTLPIRLIVAGRLPQTEPNALLHLFSASEPLLEYGRRHCRVQSPETSTLVLELFGGYAVEGLTVPVNREEFLKKAKKRIVQESTVEERLEGLSADQLLEKLIQEGKAQELTPDAREKLRRFLNDPPTV
jgi:hypothetical protein